jgi:peptidoglycan/LPS O-acetylase OafA/YrhL
METRTDIQILRGIAVTLVVLYHLTIPGFGNAFLGVDIFFVISGYLMYKLYRPERGVLDFYMRRSRRLLPAYFVTIVVTVLVASLILLPIEFGQLADQAVFGSFFASNIGFWLANSYFSKSEFTPLLHLWSLGVEIQFYLIVPLIIWLVRKKAWLLPTIIMGSLALCLLALQVSPKTSFFMMPARVWEFGVGMLVARSATGNAGLRWLGPAAMAAMPLLLLLPLHPESPSVMYGHPASSAALACLLTALVLRFGVSDRFFDNIAGRAVRYLGDISYSVYLVHFPIIILSFYEPFQGTQMGNGDFLTSFFLIVVIFACGWTLHNFIEKPSGRLVSWRTITAGSMATLFVGALAQPLHLLRFDAPTRNIVSAHHDRASFRCGRLYRFIRPGSDLCVFEPASGSRETVLLIGDSHADSIKRSFTDEAHRQGIAVAFAADNAPLIASDLNEKWLVKEAQRLGATRIFLHYTSVRNLTVPMIERARKAAAAKGIETILIMPVPVNSRSVLGLLHDAETKNAPIPTLPITQYDAANAAIIRYVETRPEKLKIIETTIAFCDPDCAFADRNWRPYYFDDTHLTLYGARRLEPSFAAALADGATVRQASY